MWTWYKRWDGIEEGGVCKHLFKWMGDATVFRKAVRAVTNENSDNVRGAVTDALLLSAGEFKVHPDAVQFYSGKTKGVQLRHHEATLGHEFQLLLDSILDRRDGA